MALLELRDVAARPVPSARSGSHRPSEGEIVAVLGANEAGKTTTLRSISGTVKRGSQILFEGKPLRRRGPESVARLGVAHVPGRGTFGDVGRGEPPSSAPTSTAARSTTTSAASASTSWISSRLDQHAGFCARSPAASSRCSRSRGR